MKFALLLLGFASGQDDWEFANKLENPNLSLNLNDIVSVLRFSRIEVHKETFSVQK